MIESVKINPGCIGCNSCENICPKVFKVNQVSTVITNNFTQDEDAILEAAKKCPVQVIDVQQDGTSTVTVTTPIQLSEKTQLTQDVYQFKFSADNFSYKPGQFVSIKFTDSKGDFYRSYSIVYGTPTWFLICVKLLKKGRGSKILKSLNPGAQLQLNTVTGTFCLQNTNREKVFIATGTGIAPMITMLQSTPKETKKTVIFGVRSESDVFYQKTLNHFSNTKIITTISRPKADWTGCSGRVTEYLDNINPEAEIYICGNPEMIDSVMEKLKNHPQEQIFHEKFFVPTAKTDLLEKFLKLVAEILLILAALTPLIWYFPNFWRDFGWNSWYILLFIMAIRPLADIFPKIKFLRALIPLRKETGILSASLILAHGSGFYLSNNLPILNSFFDFSFWTFDNNAGYAHIGGILAFILLITSNTWSQKILKRNWKRVQYLSYAFFLAGGLHIILIGREFSFSVSMQMVAILIIWYMAYMKMVLWKDHAKIALN